MKREIFECYMLLFAFTLSTFFLGALVHGLTVHHYADGSKWTIAIIIWLVSLFGMIDIIKKYGKK